MTAIEKLQQLIDESKRIVAFTGAGVSTESGIKDFRSEDGLYNEEYDFPPEIILSHSFFMQNPIEFFRFYQNKMLCKGVLPNGAHKKFAELEQAGKDKLSDPEFRKQAFPKALKAAAVCSAQTCLEHGAFGFGTEVPSSVRDRIYEGI